MKLFRFLHELIDISSQRIRLEEKSRTSTRCLNIKFMKINQILFAHKKIRVSSKSTQVLGNECINGIHAKFSFTCEQDYKKFMSETNELLFHLSNELKHFL